MRIFALLTLAASALAAQWIVELDPKGSPADALQRAHAQLRQKGAVYTTIHEYDSDLFTGLALEMASHAKALLAELEGTVEVWPSHTRKRQGHIEPIRLEHLARRAISSTANSTQATTAFGKGPNPLDFSPLVQVNVPQLRKQGLTGKGVVVGIIDDGVDFSHPALGGCFGKGCKVDRGWDFIAKAKPSVKALCADHGTHVAGIVGAYSTVRCCWPHPCC
jgi:minor extracellular serine protease Vpr